MSITLMAYPTAFLISPDKAKNEKIKEKQYNEKSNKIAMHKLRFIKVLSNMDYSELRHNMMYIPGWTEIHPGIFQFENGLNVQWKVKGRNCYAILSGCKSAKYLQQFGEEYFQKLDQVADKNVRLIKSYEYFYYNYDTEYDSIEEIGKILLSQGAKNIYASSNTEITAEIDGRNIRYYKENEESDLFTLEVETKINIVNIGLKDDYQNTSINRTALSGLKIQTNIKPEELSRLLEKSGYMYYRGNGQTPLRSVNAVLNWYLQDGTYVADFSGPDSKILKKEAEEIFRKMNIAAGRDLRYINQKSKVIYTYNTNYTDKGVLINTLLEHGAANLTESSDKITCELFDMKMEYYKKDNFSSFVLDITQVSDIKECQNIMNDLNDEYGLNIQEMTYHKIKERLASENMRLVDETVLDDNSIVLTIDIG